MLLQQDLFPRAAAAPVPVWDYALSPDEAIIDLFAGGGGTS